MKPKTPPIVEIVALLCEQFKNDQQKVALWLTIDNPHLGNVKPIDMILIGREKRLLKFVKESLSENQRDK